MWMLLSAMVVCFTIIVLFRMFIDLRRVEFQHYRSMASDRRSYERYLEASGRELPKARMPDFTAARSHAELEYLRAMQREREIRRMVEHVGYDPKLWIDPEMTELMRRG